LASLHDVPASLLLQASLLLLGVPVVLVIHAFIPVVEDARTMAVITAIACVTAVAGVPAVDRVPLVSDVLT
jgi:hypothetical protein